MLKTKESIRNEILEECAKIVKKYTDFGQTKNKMGIPKYVIEHYNEGRVTIKVKELEENIRKEILNLKEQFINRGFDDIYIDQILNECIAVIWLNVYRLYKKTLYFVIDSDETKGYPDLRW